MNSIKSPNIGDLFYTQVNGKFFFMQIIHITTNLPAPYNNGQYNYGYFIVVFEKSFPALPQTIEELDLNKVYKIKTTPKKAILYVSHWTESQEIKVKNGRIDSAKHKKYKLLYFGNADVTNKFEPKILRDFTLPSRNISNENGFIISHSPDDINWIYSRLIHDEEKQNKKKKDVLPKYFNEWLEYVEADAIIKTDKILTSFEIDSQTKDTRKALKKCTLALNKLNEKLQFITTIEAESLIEQMIKLSISFGLNDLESNEIIEKNRDW